MNMRRVGFVCSEFDGGADPSLQAVHGGVPGSARRHLHCCGGPQGMHLCLTVSQGVSVCLSGCECVCVCAKCQGACVCVPNVSQGVSVSQMPVRV